MPRLALDPITVFASAGLLLGCDSRQPFEPSPATEARVLSAQVAGADLAAPSNVTALASSGNAIAITWQDNSKNESRFEIHRSTTGETGAFTLLTSRPSGATSHSDQGLAPVLQHCYRVRAVRVTGARTVNSEFSNTACATRPPLAAPSLAAPSNATAVASSQQSILVRWQDNSSDETHFEVHRSLSGPGGPFTRSELVNANVTETTHDGIPAGTEYCYQIRGIQLPGPVAVSPFSNVTCALVIPLPASGTTAAPVNSAQVSVWWTGAGSNFRIERSIDGGGVWNLAGTATAPPFMDEVQAEQAICYRVVTYGPTFAVAPSNTDCTTAPAAPSAVTLTTVDASLIDLTWTDNSAVEDGYEVREVLEVYGCSLPGEYACDASSYEVVVAVLPANASSYRMAGTVTSAIYVYALKDGGYSSEGSRSP